MFKKLTISILSILGVVLPCAIPFGVTQGSNAIVTHALTNDDFSEGDKVIVHLNPSDYTNPISSSLFVNNSDDVHAYFTGYSAYTDSEELTLSCNALVGDYDQGYPLNYLPIIDPGVDIYYESNITRYAVNFEEDWECFVSISCFNNQDNSDFSLDIYFTISQWFEGFESWALPYVSKVTPPTPPTPPTQTLYTILYDFYYSIFAHDDLSAISTSYNMPFNSWIAHTLTIITLIIGVVLGFLFLKWLFKVISGLILLK